MKKKFLFVCFSIIQIGRKKMTMKSTETNTVNNDTPVSEKIERPYKEDECNSFNELLTISIVTDLKLDEIIRIEFISSSRDNVSYSIEYEPTQDIFGGEMKYAVRDGMGITIFNELGDLFAKLKLKPFIFRDTELLLKKGIRECMCRCESRYGNHITNFNIYGYDALLQIKGKDHE